MTTAPSSVTAFRRSVSATALFLLMSPWEAVAREKEQGGARPVEIGPCGEIVIESEQRTMTEREQPVHVHGLWESRYVSEGRDNLAGNSMSSVSTDVTFCNFTIAPWLAHSDGADYTEANINLVYSLRTSKNLALYAGYTHLRFYTPGRDSHDNEISLKASYTVLDNTDVTSTAYYSFDTRGTFIIIEAGHETQLWADATVTMSIAVGFNGDYIDTGHNGLNHGRLRLNASYAVTKSIELTAHASYSHAIDAQPGLYPGDATLKDTFWSGIGAVISF